MSRVPTWLARTLALVVAAGAPACSSPADDAPPTCATDQCDDEPTGPLWEDVTDDVLGETAEWTSKVDLADLNNDGLVDLLFANGGEYSSPEVDIDGDPIHQPNRIFLNRGPGEKFDEISDVLGEPDYARVIKGVDVNADGNLDIFVGACYESQSRLYLGDGEGGFEEVTGTNLPQRLASVGDIEFGDVDGDGDLDVVLADWGPGDAQQNDGGPVLLWLNDGAGVFTDATGDMPEQLIGMSWDLELIDVDNDYDLDVMVSCKMCDGSSLYHNDGKGKFTDASDRLPQFGNNYEFEMADFNGDGVLDVITINDGSPADSSLSLREHIFLGDGDGGFENASEELWPDDQNLGFDDNVVVILDHDSDGDPDFLIGSLDGDDRLHHNDGTGHLTVDIGVFPDPRSTQGTLGMAVSDLNNDGRLDLVQSQGELAEPERVFFGTNIPVDTAPPVISNVEGLDGDEGDEFAIRARVYDNKSPLKSHDLQSVELVTSDIDGNQTRTAMTWYGEYLWTGIIDNSEGKLTTYEICSTDKAGNEACSSPLEL